MRGFIWNSDGLGSPANHLTFNEADPEHKLDFVAMLETGRSNFATPFLNFLVGAYDYNWYCLPPRGRSGGILVGFNNAVLAV